MASESQTSLGSTLFSWPGVMVIAALLGIVISNVPLSSRRPSAPMEFAAGSNDGPGVYYCRMAEDPWQALARETRQPESAKGKGFSPEISLTEFIKPVGIDDRLCVLPIVVYGDLRTAEATESRTRTRVAVAAGLGACGYIPDKDSRLTRLDLHRGNRTAGLCGDLDPPDFPDIPAEIYISNELPRSGERAYRRILVLWILDSWIFDKPLQKLEALEQFLHRTLRPASFGNPSQFEDPAFQFKVIGPWWSGILTDMMKERSEFHPFSPMQLAPHVKLYSATATMADAVMDVVCGLPSQTAKDKVKTEDRPLSGRNIIQSQVGKFYNLTCTDDRLALNLLRELSLRGVDPMNEETRIVIISDWNSQYGRTLPLTFAAVLKQQLQTRNFGSLHESTIVEPRGELDADFVRGMYTDDPSAWPRQIVRAHYFNGIDGQVALSTEATPRNEGAHQAVANDSKKPEIERAEGTQQVDNIRRFAASLRDRIREFDAPEHKPGQLRAIGIMGSDVYDKLLLLRALRPIFPGVLFFTIGLDARLMHPDELPFTRNLIVGSPFGLELFRTFQLGAPPFRDTNETAVFLAVQAAMERDEKFNNQVYSPQLFEISRRGPVSLVKPWARSESDAKEDLVGLANKWQGFLYPSASSQDKRVFPDWQAAAGKMLQTLAGVVCFMLVVALVFLGHALPRRENKRYLLVAGFSFSAVMMIGIFLLLYDGIEPLSFLNGTSLWPSELIRLAATLLGLGFLVAIHTSLKNHFCEAERDFGLVGKNQMMGTRFSDYLDEIWNLLGRKNLESEKYVMSNNAILPTQPGVPSPVCDTTKPSPEQSSSQEGPSIKRVDVESLWNCYYQDVRPFTRFGQAAVMMVIYVAGCLLLLAVVGKPLVPYRGNFSEVWDTSLSWASGLMLIFLIFVVVSVTDSTKRLIERLSTPYPTWWKISSNKPGWSCLSWPDYEKAVSYYQDVKFIGKITAVTLRFIYFPFILLTLLILARWTYFANWQWTPFIIILYFADAAICVYCAILLRMQAVRAKKEAIVAMSEYIARAQIDCPSAASSLAMYRQEIETNQEGAFTPWSRQPIVSALLIPLGSGGLIQLIQQFSNL